jgi:hypothetical protein
MGGIAMTEPSEKNGASGDNAQPNTPPPTTPPASPKFETIDGGMTVDGRKVVYESDLIASKKSLEVAAEQAHTVHTDAIDKAKLELSDTQQQLAAANAKMQGMEQASKTGATSATDEDVARIKQEAVDAKANADQSSAKMLELKMSLLAMQYQIPKEHLEGKDAAQLDSFEEALKALATSRGGAGPYAAGGGGSGSDAPQTPMDRATAIIANTPIRGIRNAPAQ